MFIFPGLFLVENFGKFQILVLIFTIFSFKLKKKSPNIRNHKIKKKAMTPIIKINLNYLRLWAKFTKPFPSALPRMHKLLYIGVFHCWQVCPFQHTSLIHLVRFF
jgi:hypothetical protein